jgi:hypothetical protein
LRCRPPACGDVLRSKFVFLERAVLFLLGWRRYHLVRPGFVAVFARLVFGLAVAYVVTIVMLYAYLLLSGHRIEPGDSYHTDGTTPLVIHGADRAAACYVGDHTLITAPIRERPRATSIRRGYHAVVDGVPKQINCGDTATVVESRLVSLSWLVESDWFFFLPVIPASVGFTVGWSTWLVRRRPSIPELSGSSPRRVTSRRRGAALGPRR